MKPLLVLCLGNEILSDDSFGFHLSESLKRFASELSKFVDIIFAPLAGFSLIDFLAERQKVLIVDTIITGEAPAGTVHFFPMGDLTPSHNLTTSHEILLPTALKLAEMMGMTAPEEIDILAVEAQDVRTLSEEMTEPIMAAMPAAIEYVTRWIIIRSQEILSNGERNKKNAAC